MSAKETIGGVVAFVGGIFLGLVVQPMIYPKDVTDEDCRDLGLIKPEDCPR